MKYFMARSLITILVFFVSACSTTGPADNVGFKGASGIESLVGTYRNLGEGMAGQYSVKHSKYLSEIIWPGEAEWWHSSIKEVVVQKASERSLRVAAIKDNTESKSISFEEGKDFTIRNGRVKLKLDVGAAGSFQEGAALVHYETIELGVDKNDDGKYRQSTGIIGVFFLVLPLFGESHEDIRFVRLDKPTRNELTTP